MVDEATCQDAAGNPKCVDVAIRPHALRLYLLRVGSNILPIPRTNRPTFFDKVPAPLLALNPTFVTAYDREFGLSLGGAIATNLLDLPKLIKGEPVTPGETQFRLQASGRKSLTESFYNANTDLAFSQHRIGQIAEDVALSGHYAANDQPLGDGRYVSYGFGAGASVGVRPRIEPFKRVTLGANYRWSRNKLYADPANEIDSENAGWLQAHLPWLRYHYSCCLNWVGRPGITY